MCYNFCSACSSILSHALVCSVPPQDAKVFEYEYIVYVGTCRHIMYRIYERFRQLSTTSCNVSIRKPQSSIPIRAHHGASQHCNTHVAILFQDHDAGGVCGWGCCGGWHHHRVQVVGFVRLGVWRRRWLCTCRARLICG